MWCLWCKDNGGWEPELSIIHIISLSQTHTLTPLQNTHTYHTSPGKRIHLGEHEIRNCIAWLPSRHNPITPHININMKLCRLDDLFQWPWCPAPCLCLWADTAIHVQKQPLSLSGLVTWKLYNIWLVLCELFESQVCIAGLSVSFICCFRRVIRAEVKSLKYKIIQLYCVSEIFIIYVVKYF